MVDLLIAGPILRRVTPEIVCVWLATNQKSTLKLSVLQGNKSIGESDITLIDEQCCQLGKQLYIYLLQAKPIEQKSGEPSTFPYDIKLSYRLDDVENTLAKPINLKVLKLTYTNENYPSFFIPKYLKRFLHGSCRKPHGHVAINQPNFDALSLGDKELEANYSTLETRPALLLLTGDQIYADDVADSIFTLVHQQARELLGYQEILPNKSGGIIDLTVSNASSRKQLADDEAGFSSEAAENHLFTFAEFAAMYLYVFGNAQNWTPDFASEKNAGIQKALAEFHSTLPNVRRLLANIPTYMIFDDHDVTDDWNITGGWYDKVRDLPFGHRVISNALAAAWAFQGWGNAPDNFDNDLVRAVVNFLATETPSSNVTQQYDLNTWKHRGWSYSIPTNPPVIVIDSRTQRQPDGTFYPPQLLDRYALDWLRVEWLKLMVKKEKELKDGIINQMPSWPLIVTTTPVMGFAPIEGLQQFVLWLIGVIEDNLIVRFIERRLRVGGIGTYYLGNILDAEGWLSNRDGYGNFLNCLLVRMEIEHCVFLSGDVHYSFTAKASFDNVKKTLNCWQLTSSSLCNTPSDQQIKLINRVAKEKGHAEHNNRWAWNPMQRWKSKIQYVPEHGSSNHRIIGKCNIGLVELTDGKPVKHTLVSLNEANVFLLDNNIDEAIH